MSKIKTIQLIPRLVIACITGLLIFGIGLNATWTNSQGHAEQLQTMTRKRIKNIDSDIQAFVKKNGKLPTSLNVVGVDPKYPSYNDAGLLDRWGHSYVYRLTKNTYTLISYGHDGKPGGVGIDSDISTDNTNSKMPFLQVFNVPWASTMILGSIIAAIFTFFLTFFLIRPADISRERWGCLLAKLLPTLVFLIFLTLLIVLLDYPSGH